MEAYLLFIKHEGVVGVYSTYDNAFNETDIGEMYSIYRTKLDRTVETNTLKFEVKLTDGN